MVASRDWLRGLAMATTVQGADLNPDEDGGGRLVGGREEEEEQEEEEE